MPRQRRSAPAPRTQTRSAHTAAAPAHSSYPSAHPPSAASHPVQQQSQGPGLFGQMASTAAGVAVGSTIGHTLGAGITSMFGGSSAPAEAPPAQPAQSNYQEQSRSCDVDAKNFTRCLGDNDGNMQICDYYLQQLKACQEASKHY
ncbi:hypothetical protein HYPBUDRAFT_132062 [Hyphopichia burtonii NRRL Y-1933]|uniref:CHCH domain-containing protein n=1 Tax=Hyphopichia burtonii NRRL Y-1933 TaxID=984485 RepID=A0A1E4RR59_9ASCO|nr:hypothetical protein HYPBUDRAFT_132062 [Hyphopichia burtonii NRRL Y-1933]ODV69737.1 hypothetical protein HYPBUDRAFT_132062 [Hyphopichia burtonii NRRL Y-1933]